MHNRDTQGYAEYHQYLNDLYGKGETSDVSNCIRLMEEFSAPYREKTGRLTLDQAQTVTSEWIRTRNKQTWTYNE